MKKNFIFLILFFVIFDSYAFGDDFDDSDDGKTPASSSSGASSNKGRSGTKFSVTPIVNLFSARKNFIYFENQQQGDVGNASGVRPNVSPSGSSGSSGTGSSSMVGNKPSGTSGNSPEGVDSDSDSNSNSGGSGGSGSSAGNASGLRPNVSSTASGSSSASGKILPLPNPYSHPVKGTDGKYSISQPSNGTYTVTKSTGGPLGLGASASNSGVAVGGGVASGTSIEVTRNGVPFSDLSSVKAEIPKTLTGLKSGDTVRVINRTDLGGAVGVSSAGAGMALEPSKSTSGAVLIEKTLKGATIQAESIIEKGKGFAGGVVVLAGKDKVGEMSTKGVIIDTKGDSKKVDLLYQQISQNPGKAIEIISQNPGVIDSKTALGYTKESKFTDSILGAGIPIVAGVDRNQYNEAFQLNKYPLGKEGSPISKEYGFNTGKTVDAHFADIGSVLNTSIGGGIVVPIAKGSSEKAGPSLVNGEIRFDYSSNTANNSDIKKAIENMAKSTGLLGLVGATSELGKNGEVLGDFSASLKLKYPNEALDQAMAMAAIPASREKKEKELQAFAKARADLIVTCNNNHSDPRCAGIDWNAKGASYGDTNSAISKMLSALTEMSATKLTDPAKFAAAYNRFSAAMLENQVAFQSGLMLLGTSKLHVEFDAIGKRVTPVHLEGDMAANNLGQLVLLPVAKKAEKDKIKQIDQKVGPGTGNTNERAATGVR